MTPGKKPGGKKAWWKKWKWKEVERKPGGKKAWCLFLGVIHVKIDDEVKLTDNFNQLPFQPFDFKMFFWYLEFIFLVQFIFITIEYKICKIYYAFLEVVLK